MSIFFSLIILGLIQGLTEFLPVSSSGHLVLFSRIFGVEESLFVSIILHAATLLSIVIVFRKKLLNYIKHPLCDDCKKLVVATIPTCIIVLVLMPILNKSFEGNFLPICFMITAALLTATNLLYLKKKKVEPYKNVSFEGFKLTYGQALTMGIMQGLAVFPGISRSGSTICGGIIAGGDREDVAEFSFLMSIPIIILSLVKELYEIIVESHTFVVNIPGLIIGSIVAFVVGIFSIKFMINLTKKMNFIWFAIYLFVLAIVCFFILF